jgi:hypothetical protein
VRKYGEHDGLVDIVNAGSYRIQSSTHPVVVQLIRR